MGATQPGLDMSMLDPNTALQMQLNMEMLRQFRSLNQSTGYRDDAPGSDELDGLRVARSLSRMRTLRENMERDPD